MTILDLGKNQISDSLPADISQLSALTELNLQYNRIYGAFPPGLFDMVNLTKLVLWRNQISDTIPKEIGQLVNLQYMDLDENLLGGEIPPEIGNLMQLQTLWLDNNNFTGTIPAGIGNLTQLADFGVAGNRLSGPLPVELGNLVNLIQLSLENNSFSGSIPTQIGNLIRLQYLLAYNNQLSGPVPNEIGNLTQLTYLYLFSNHLSGPVPAAMNNLTGLQILNVENNDLDSLPDLSGLTTLREVYLRHNNFTFGDLQNTGLDFSAIPTVFYAPQSNLEEPLQNQSGDTITLHFHTSGAGNTYQWFSDGGLITGKITNELKINADSGIYYCRIYNSAFPELVLETKPVFMNTDNSHGVFRKEYDALVALYDSTQGDHWSDHFNWLSTKPVDSWKGIRTSAGHITSIDLQNNNLSGPIPSAIGEFPFLTDLYLHANHLSGTIPESLYNLTSLRDLGLYLNNLEGTISPSIKNLVNLNALQMSNNNFTGSIPSEIGELARLYYIDLSRTKLSGAVPASLNNLVGLQYLYLYDTDLSDLPDLSALTNLRVFFIQLDKFTFEDFINTGLDFNSHPDFYYHDQDPLEVVNMNLIYNDGDQITLNCREIIRDDLWSTDNHFLLFRNDLPVYSGSDPEYNISSFSANDTGYYFIRVTNSGFPNGYLQSKLFTVEMNEAPVDISITQDSVEENEPTGTVVGTLSASDQNEGDSLTFSLVNGNGSNDSGNAAFTIVENELKTAARLDFETRSEYHIYVQTEDAGGLTNKKAFVINVLDVNEAPSGMSFSDTTVAEDASVGTVVGQFSTTDPDIGDSFVYSLVSGNGSNDADNAAFTIEGSKLKTASDLDFETQSEYHIYVQTEDAGSLSHEKAFVIAITDVVEAGINGEGEKGQISVYPNPSEGIYYINMNEAGDRIEVADLSGKIVYATVPTTKSVRIDLSHLARGIYFVKIREKEDVVIRKIVKL